MQNNADLQMNEPDNPVNTSKNTDCEIEQLEWLKLSESAFSFWNDPCEDLYQDLIPREI